MYFFRLTPKPEIRAMFSRQLEPRDVRRHIAEAGIGNTRFSVESDDQGLKVTSNDQYLIELIRRRLSRRYHTDPVEQVGFERRRVHVH